MSRVMSRLSRDRSAHSPFGPKGWSNPEGAPVAPGDVVADKYVVEAVLGSGAMGFVVSARHKLIGQRVAIKLIKSSYVADEDALARFGREARALVAVQSENVVRVFDFGALADHSPYLVMELLEGRDLFRELSARGPLPLGEASEIILQACEGLAAVHARGIVHRDIKPANLFLTTRAKGKLLVKIVDFGVSKAPKATEEELSLTHNSLGSPHYMSPEQLRSARTVDARSDIWSLGVTLHRALTGELPFAGESMGVLMASVMTDSPRPLRASRPDLPPEMAAIVRRCLEKNAEARFGSALELADALAPFAMPADRARDVDRVAGESSAPPPLAGAAGAGAAGNVGAALYESTAKAHVSSLFGHVDEARDAQKKRAVLLTAIAAPLALAAIALGIAPKGSSRVTNGSDAAAARAAIAATAVPDIPLPKTTNGEAAAAYQTAFQAVRDASLVSAHDHFVRAASLDPTMAAAELRSALYGAGLVGADSRLHARAAMALRASLSERDRELLGALEPLYVNPRPDAAAASRRMDALILARPGDAELLFLSAMLFVNRRSRESVLATCDRVLELDPKFAAAAWLRALAYGLMWDLPAALRATDRCLAIASSAASCVRVRATIEDATGDCSGLEADAQRMVAMEGTSYRAYDFLAVALFARGEPLDAVREALRLKVQASAARARPGVALLDEARLAVATGDFTGALKSARALEDLARTSGVEKDRAAAALLQVELHTELGEPLVAGQVADEYLRRRGAWPATDAIDDDPRPRLYAAAVHAGLRSPSERDAARAEWLATWSAQLALLERANVWLEGYAAPAETREEAEQALAALPDYAPVPALTLGGWAAPALAKVYALAGRDEDALPSLRFVASSCRTLSEPGDVIRAQLRLGEALEGTGDEAGACAAYGTVIDRWGSERRSVSANTALTRATALGCAR